MTFVLVVLYLLKCKLLLMVWLVVTTFMILLVMGGFFMRELFATFNYPIDWFTVLVFAWNLAGVGCVVIYWKGPLRLQQAFLIISSALVALSFIKMLPDWTLWIFIAVLAIWDLSEFISFHVK